MMLMMKFSDQSVSHSQIDTPLIGCNLISSNDYIENSLFTVHSTQMHTIKEQQSMIVDYQSQLLLATNISEDLNKMNQKLHNQLSQKEVSIFTVKECAYYYKLISYYCFVCGHCVSLNTIARIALYTTSLIYKKHFTN